MIAQHSGAPWRRLLLAVVLVLAGFAVAPAAAAAPGDTITFPHAEVLLDERSTYVPNGPGHADFIHRLYAGLLLRPPDDVGWAYWVSLLDTGTTTRGRIVDEFIESEEFRIRFGTERAAVVRNLYLNTLGRQPDQDGYDYWLATLEFTPVADVVGLFLESDENLRRMRNQGPTSFPVTDLPFRYSNTLGTAAFDWPETIRIDNNPGTFVRLEVPEYELPPYTAVYGGDCFHPNTGVDVGGVANVWLNSIEGFTSPGDLALTSPDGEYFWRFACVDTVNPGDYDWSIAHEVAHLWQPVVMGSVGYAVADWPDPIERIADCVKVHYGGVAAYGLGPCPDTNVDELIVQRMTPGG